jgi:hypothetical protein
MEIQENTTVHIWQGEWHDERNVITFMYKPVVESIIDFFMSSLGVPRDRINYRVNCFEWHTFVKGDVFVWVGCVSIPDFHAIRLSHGGVYTIYYNTEPVCEDVASDEVWTYSRFMYSEICKSCGGKKLSVGGVTGSNQVTKYVPIICEKGAPRVRYGEEPVSQNIAFLGYILCRHCKFHFFSPEFIANIFSKYDLWNDTYYNAFLLGTPYIYLNLTKFDTIAMPSVRVNKLLSHGAIIVSENVHEDDQADYEGLVFFGDLTQLEGIFRGLLEKSAEELREISDAIYSRFCAKFGGVQPPPNDEMTCELL